MKNAVDHQTLKSWTEVTVSAVHLRNYAKVKQNAVQAIKYVVKTIPVVTKIRIVVNMDDVINRVAAVYVVRPIKHATEVNAKQYVIRMDLFYVIRKHKNVSAIPIRKQPYSRSVTTLVDPKRSKREVGDCISRLNEKSLQYVGFDGKICSGKFDCSTGLPACDATCAWGDENKSCCKDKDGKYTGQVCPTDQTCSPDGECGYGYRVDESIEQGPIKCVFSRDSDPTGF